MKLTDIDLSKMLNFDPGTGKLLLDNDRMLLFRQDSFAVLRKLMFDQLGETHARAIISMFGYRCGHGDFETLNRLYEWDTEEDRFGAGPVMHTWEGIVHVEPTFLEFDRGTGHFHMTGIWRNSYEAEIHLSEFGPSDAPVCHSLTGYASGWSSAFFGCQLVAIETKCMGMGHDRCEFEIKPHDKWDDQAEPWVRSLESTNSSMVKELEEKILVIQKQASEIADLSTPVMEVWDDILVLPVYGLVDSRRRTQIMETLLQSIVDTQSKCVIIDITGVEIVDTKTADHMLKVVRAATLLGTRSVLTGLRPAVAQTLVELGADLNEVRTLRNLKEGLSDSIRYLRSLETSGFKGE